MPSKYHELPHVNIEIELPDSTIQDLETLAVRHNTDVGDIIEQILRGDSKLQEEYLELQRTIQIKAADIGAKIWMKSGAYTATKSIRRGVILVTLCWKNSSLSNVFFLISVSSFKSKEPKDRSFPRLIWREMR